MAEAMDSTDTISALLSRLTITENKIETLEELKTLISLIPRRDLRDTIPNISIGNIFNCMNTADKAQQTVCGEILNSMLSTLSSTTILENFNSYLLQWLQVPEDSVKSLCLSQICRLCRESPADVCHQETLLLAIVELLSSENIEVGLAASKAVTHLGKDPSGLQTLFSHPVVDQIALCMQTNDTVRFRIYQMAIDICCCSTAALDACANAGLLQQLINETMSESGDLLVQLNAIELVSDLARSPHGLAFLDRQGVVSKMESLMLSLQENPMAGLLVPGLIKFYGGLAMTHPKEVLSKFSRFVSLVFGSISDTDPSLSAVSLDTVAFIASTPEGKLALDQLGNPMTECVQAIGRSFRQGTSDTKHRALNSLARLLYLQTEHQTTELLALTQRWFQASIPDTDPFKAVWSVARQPFSDIRIPAFRLLKSLAMVPWGQRLMNNSAGFTEYLLDRSTENSKEGKEEKYEVVKILADSPTCIDILGRPYQVKLKEYVNEGAFFVMAQSEVAMEGET